MPIDTLEIQRYCWSRVRRQRWPCFDAPECDLSMAQECSNAANSCWIPLLLAQLNGSEL